MMNGWGFGYGGGGRGGFPQRFEEQYHCYSVAYADKAHLEKGDKILLPPSAFDTLARLQVDYPMLFRLENPSKGTMTHCGVLEFTAQEGTCYIPFWMMQNLLLEEGQILTVQNVSLPKATFVKLQPQHVDFLEISNPRAILEFALRNFSCVTKGDVICVPYNDKNYYLELKEVQPQDAACIIETDCNVDFDPPVGYKEPTRNTTSAASSRSGSVDSSTMIPIAKQTATRGGTGSSTCPSPTPSSLSGSQMDVDDGVNNSSNYRGPRIVNGQIVRPKDGDGDNDDDDEAVAAILAKRTGQTGVQRNAAIPVRAPEVDYWAVSAGDGARLDGKTPAVLKHKDGSDVDVRKLRAEAAAKRAAAAQRQQEQAAAAFPAGTATTSSNTSDNGSHGGGQEGTTTDAATNTAMAPVSKRKSRVGSKYSKLKSSSKAFQGSAKSMDG